MNLDFLTKETIWKVEFIKPFEYHRYPYNQEDIEFDDLLKLLNKVEEKAGQVKSRHKEAFTGIDYLGNDVKFTSYCIHIGQKIIKYNFPESYIPLNNEIIRRKRNQNIDDIINEV